MGVCDWGPTEEGLQAALRVRDEVQEEGKGGMALDLGVNTAGVDQTMRAGFVKHQ